MKRETIDLGSMEIKVVPMEGEEWKDKAILISGLQGGPVEFKGDRITQKFRWKDAVLLTNVGNHKRIGSKSVESGGER